MSGWHLVTHPRRWWRSGTVAWLLHVAVVDGDDAVVGISLIYTDVKLADCTCSSCFCWLFTAVRLRCVFALSKGTNQSAAMRLDFPDRRINTFHIQIINNKFDCTTHALWSAVFSTASLHRAKTTQNSLTNTTRMMHFCLHSQAYQARATNNDTSNCAIPQLIMGKNANHSPWENTQNSNRKTQDALETNGHRIFFLLLLSL